MAIIPKDQPEYVFRNHLELGFLTETQVQTVRNQHAEDDTYKDVDRHVGYIVTPE